MNGLKVGVLVLAVALGVSGCASAPSPTTVDMPKPYELPELIQYTYRWGAEPGLDLFGVRETAVRAYLESYYVASFAHSTAAGYPGFEKAAGHVQYYPVDRPDINDRTNYNPNPIIGTLQFHLMSLTDTEQGFQAMACRGDYSLSSARPDGTYSNFGGRYPQAMLVDFVPGPDGTSLVSHTGEGPARAPQTDMFGGWTVTRHGFTTGDFDDRYACEYKFPDAPETRPTRVNDTVAVPYPTLPPYPGWAVPAQ
ncbi:MAG: hypothetical protein WAX14_00630 [Rhodococcus sp. (in: high G+C Gram-positive bacteria)]|uniref:hypothetical protein n=1 Tax=Rhodococcus sp. TaxID=1831 RepID=UPI003BB5E902